MRWYVSRGGKSAGPVSEETMATYARAGKLAGAMVRDENSPGWTPVERSPFAQLFPAQQADPQAQLPQRREGWPPSHVFIGILVVAAPILLVLYAAFGPANSSSEVVAEPEATRGTNASPPPPNPLVQIMSKRTTTQAIAFAKPLMSDTSDDISPGAVLFAHWASVNLSWGELSAIPETRQTLVMKDPSATRGLRICAPGQLIEIRRSGELFEGGIFNGGFDKVVRFIAVKSTGTLTQGDSGRFCGVIIGVQSYSNSSGGMTHAVCAVGMFDLPENRTTDP